MKRKRQYKVISLVTHDAKDKLTTSVRLNHHFQVSNHKGHYATLHVITKEVPYLCGVESEISLHNSAVPEWTFCVARAFVMISEVPGVSMRALHKKVVTACTRGPQVMFRVVAKAGLAK